jgi:hypothetical protein
VVLVQVAKSDLSPLSARWNDPTPTMSAHLRKHRSFRCFAQNNAVLLIGRRDAFFNANLQALRLRAASCNNRPVKPFNPLTASAAFLYFPIKLKIRRAVSLLRSENPYVFCITHSLGSKKSSILDTSALGRPLEAMAPRLLLIRTPLLELQITDVPVSLPHPPEWL